MKISKTQLDSVQIPDRQFVDWYVEEIMKDELRHFYVDLGPDTCRTFTLNGRRYAEHFGFSEARLQAQFLTLMWELGPNFHTVGAFRTVLEDDRLDQEQKIEALYSVSDAAGEQAIEQADDEHWYPELIEGNILGVPFEPEEHRK